MKYIFFLTLLLLLTATCKREDDLNKAVGLLNGQSWTGDGVVFLSGADDTTVSIRILAGKWDMTLGIINCPLKTGTVAVEGPKSGHSDTCYFLVSTLKDDGVLGTTYFPDTTQSNYFEITHLSRADKVLEGKFRLYFRIPDYRDHPFPGDPDSVFWEVVSFKIPITIL